MARDLPAQQAFQLEKTPKKSRSSGRQCNQGGLALPQTPVDGNLNRNSVPPAPGGADIAILVGVGTRSGCRTKAFQLEKAPKKSSRSGRQCNQDVLVLPQAPVDGNMKRNWVSPAPWVCPYSYFDPRPPHDLPAEQKHSSWKRPQRNPAVVIGSATKMF